MLSLFQLGIFLLWLLVTTVTCVFGLNFALLAWINLRKEKLVNKRKVSDWPMVSIHIPVYNEANVIERTLKACLDLDYPKDRLEVIIVDDSTDKTTSILKRYERQSSPKVKVIHRNGREGFKAGALNRAMKESKGEFFFVLDADTVPRRSFLKEAIPHLYSDEKIAFVQGKLGNVNRESSWLTKSFSLIYDWYRVFVQSALYKGGLPVCSVGSAVIYRRKALESVGGWNSDTLTEDLDMSYKLRMNGWKGAFVLEAVCEDEAPVFYSTFLDQYERHLKGPIQNLKKYGRAIIRSRNMTLFQKMEALLILSNPISLPLGLLSIVLGILSYLVLPVEFVCRFWVSIFGYTFSAFCFVSFVSMPIGYFLMAREESRLKFFVYLAGVGLILGDHLLVGTKAILDLLFRKSTSFTRTQKLGSISRRSFRSLRRNLSKGRKRAIGIRLLASIVLLFSFLVLSEKGLLLYSLGFLFPAVSWIASIFFY